MTARAVLSAMLLIATGCSQRTSPHGPLDSGTPQGDAGMTADAAGMTDAGTMTDAGHGPDASTLDAGAGDASMMSSEGGPADAAATDGATCTLLGDYSITFMGMTAYFRFNSDGTWVGAMTRAELDTSTVGGTYTSDGTTMTITDDGTASDCTPGQIGTYSLSFDASCAAMLTLVSDACGSRAAVLGAVTFVPLT